MEEVHFGRWRCICSCWQYCSTSTASIPSDRLSAWILPMSARRLSCPSTIRNGVGCVLRPSVATCGIVWRRILRFASVTVLQLCIRCIAFVSQNCSISTIFATFSDASSGRPKRRVQTWSLLRERRIDFGRRWCFGVLPLTPLSFWVAKKWAIAIGCPPPPRITGGESHRWLHHPRNRSPPTRTCLSE